MDFFTAREYSNADLKKIVADAEENVSTERAKQMEALEELELRQAHRAEASASMHQWVASTFDLAPETARSLVSTAHRWRGYPKVRNALEAGEITFDRAAALARLPVGHGFDVRESLALDITGLRRSVARFRRLSSADEQRAFIERYAVAQPTLDESSWRVDARLPGLEGRVFAKAIEDRADEFRGLPGGEASTRAQRQADALVAMAHDSLDRSGDEVSVALSVRLPCSWISTPPTAPAGRSAPRSNMGQGSVPTPSTSSCAPGRYRWWD